MSTTNADLLVSAGAKPLIFYCPGLLAGVNEREWQRWWSFRPERRIVGFAFLIKQAPNDNRAGLAGFKLYSRLTETNNPSEAELIVDENMSMTPTPPFDFRVVSANVSPENGGAYNPPHPTRDRVPKGGDILFLDSHVEWRKFVYPTEMRPRFRAPSSSQPYYFY
jgi:hypothetical protein